MTKEELINRNKKFVIEVVRLVDVLPSNRVHDAFVRQVVRSASSIGANYRAACRAKSKADFVNKLKIVEEEADGTVYFLELLDEVDGNKNKTIFNKLIREANELVAIYTASLKTMKTK